jgi:hypothetical protein
MARVTNPAPGVLQTLHRTMIVVSRPPLADFPGHAGQQGDQN